MILMLLSSAAVVTGIVISISKQEYMFGYKAPVVAVKSFLDLLINYVDARASVPLRSNVPDC